MNVTAVELNLIMAANTQTMVVVQYPAQVLSTDAETVY